MMSGDDFQTRRDASNPLYLESELSLPEDHDGPPVFGGDVVATISEQSRSRSRAEQIGPYRILELIAEGGMGPLSTRRAAPPVSRTSRSR